MIRSLLSLAGAIVAAAALFVGGGSSAYAHHQTLTSAYPQRADGGFILGGDPELLAMTQWYYAAGPVKYWRWSTTPLTRVPGVVQNWETSSSNEFAMMDWESLPVTNSILNAHVRFIDKSDPCGNSSAPACWNPVYVNDDVRNVDVVSHGTVELNEANFNFTNAGYNYALAHEIGHVYGLAERYNETNGTANASETTIMDLGAQTGSIITGGADGSIDAPQTIDLNRVRAFWRGIDTISTSLIDANSGTFPNNIAKENSGRPAGYLEFDLERHQPPVGVLLAGLRLDGIPPGEIPPEEHGHVPEPRLDAAGRGHLRHREHGLPRTPAGVPAADPQHRPLPLRLWGLQDVRTSDLDGGRAEPHGGLGCPDLFQLRERPVVPFRRRSPNRLPPLRPGPHPFTGVGAFLRFRHLTYTSVHAPRIERQPTGTPQNGTVLRRNHPARA